MKLFVVAVCFCFGAGGGPVSFRAVKLFAVAVVSFGVWCETVCRRRRLFLFWGGRGPVSFRAVKLFVVVAVCFCFGAGGGQSASGL